MELLDLFDLPPARKASTRSNNRMKQAFYSSMTGKWLVMESYLEFCCGVEFEIDWKVLRVKTQPERRKFLLENGRIGTTTPDFLIETMDGIEIIECKYKAQEAKYKHRTNELKKIYGKLGATYRIINEIDMDLANEERHFNALEIFTQRLRDIPYELPFQVGEAFAKSHLATIGDLEEALGKRLVHRRDIYKLHVDGYISIDYKSDLIGPDTRIAHIRDIRE